MSIVETDTRFAGSLPAQYQTHLVPLIFEPYAADLTRRLAGWAVTRVLEVAAGTGVVTRRLAAELPARVTIIATDLNQDMLDQAAAAGTPRAVEWRQADAMSLPFPDGEFDAVVCQFGVMFFPDKPKAFAEARRVLRAGGVLLFNAWDRLEENEFAFTVTEALAELFPSDPPRFLARTPHGYSDRATIRWDLAAGGFTAEPRLTTVAAQSRAESPAGPATGYCQGTPLRTEIEARRPGGLDQATAWAGDAVAGRFGRGPVEGKLQAHVVAVER